jgi:asparagine synthase (glutamine-hydrolysing)
MCGINGIFAYHYAANPIDRAELRRTRDHMVARGPDGTGEWISPDERVGFGHQRLAIIDLSDAGMQPMASADGKLVVTYNGEVRISTCSTTRRCCRRTCGAAPTSSRILNVTGSHS